MKVPSTQTPMLRGKHDGDVYVTVHPPKQGQRVYAHYNRKFDSVYEYVPKIGLMHVGYREHCKGK